MSATYCQKGESIDYKNVGADPIRAGDIVATGTARIGVAGCDIAPDATGSLHIVGVFEFQKAAQAIAFGETVKYDPATGEFSATGAVTAGWAIASSDASSKTVLVKIG